MKRWIYSIKPHSGKKRKNTEKFRQSLKPLKAAKNLNAIELDRSDIIKASEIYQRNKSNKNVRQIVYCAFPGKTGKYLEALYNAVSKKK